MLSQTSNVEENALVEFNICSVAILEFFDKTKDALLSQYFKVEVHFIFFNFGSWAKIWVFFDNPMRYWPDTKSSLSRNVGLFPQFSTFFSEGYLAI